MMKIKILIMTAILTTAAALSFGQQPSGPRDHDDTVSEKKHEEVRKKVGAVRIWKLTEKLKLDTETSARVSSLLSSIDLKRKDLQREQMESMKILRQAIDVAKPDQAKIRTHLDKLDKNQHALQDLREKEMSGVKSLLTVEQQARYVLFQQEFRREMRGMIEDARGSGRGKGPRDGNEPGMRDRQQRSQGRQADK